MIRAALVLWSLVALITLSAVAGASPAKSIDLGKLPLYFIENQGQLDHSVHYYLDGGNASVTFGRQGLTFTLDNNHVAQSTVYMDFIGARAVSPTGFDRTSAKISTFVGSRSQWRTSLPNFHALHYYELWPGVTLALGGTHSRLKYTFVVKAGADAGAIAMRYRGARSVAKNAEQLHVTATMGSFIDDAPTAFQEIHGHRVTVPVAYAVGEAGRFHFAIGAYDHTQPLYIDPTIISYSGYGGSSNANGEGIAVDAAGAAYVTTSAGVKKISADGSALVYSIAITADRVSALALDSMGRAYVAGEVTASTIPVTMGAWNTVHQGGRDAYLCRVSADGTAFEYCGYYGSSHTDQGFGVVVDPAFNAYLVGNTNGTAFVAKISADGSTMPYSLILGTGQAYAVAVDAGGAAFVTGSVTALTTVISGPKLTTTGDGDGFACRVKVDGSGVDYCGYLGGGSGGDQGHGIAVDGSDNAYVVGYTESGAGFPLAGTLDITPNGGRDAFVCKLTGTGTITYCSFLGGALEDDAHGVALDASNNVYVSGYTLSSEATFPDTGAGPSLQISTPPTNDLQSFLCKINAAGTALDFCGYVPNAYNGRNVAIDASGAAYVIGEVNASPVKVSPAAPSGIAVESTSNATGSGVTLTFEHSVGEDSGRVLTVGVSFANPNSEIVSGITWGGTALTKVGDATNANAARAELWALTAPASGIKPIVVTMSAAASISAGAISFIGVNQTDPLGAFVAATGTSTLPSVSVDASAGDFVVDVHSGAGTATAGQTAWWSGGSTQPVASSGMVTASWTTTNQAWASGAVTLKLVGPPDMSVIDASLVDASPSASDLASDVATNGDLASTNDASTNDASTLDSSQASSGCSCDFAPSRHMPSPLSLVLLLPFAIYWRRRLG